MFLSPESYWQYFILVLSLPFWWLCATFVLNTLMAFEAFYSSLLFLGDIFKTEHFRAIKNFREFISEDKIAICEAGVYEAGVSGFKFSVLKTTSYCKNISGP